jgi:hypothetical protein
MPLRSRLIVLLATLSVTSLVAADPLALTVHTDQTTKTISTGTVKFTMPPLYAAVVRVTP